MVKHVYLGKSDVSVHPIGLGTNAVGGHNLYPNLDEEQGRNVVRTALDHGTNLLDTAYSYGNGRSEELVGEVMAEYKREDIALATKGAQRFVEEDKVIDNSPSFLRQTVEDSLRRLKTDYIDLFYIHFPDKQTPKDEAVGALKELKDEGKIRAIGVSNFTMDQLKEANKDGYVDVLQGGYNLIHREAEHDFLLYTARENITFIPFFPLESGLLTGKYDENSKFSDLRAKKPAFQGEAFKQNLKKVDRLREIANKKNAEVANIVLAWYLTRTSLDVVIPGAKRPEQVANNIKTVEVSFTDDEIEQIDSIFS